MGGGESFYCPALLVCDSVICMPGSQSSVLGGPLMLLVPSISFINKSDSSQLFTLLSVFQSAHNLVGRGVWFIVSPKYFPSLTVFY